MATSPLPSQRPNRWQNCYITPAFSGVSNTKHGNKIRSGYLTDAFSAAQKRTALLHNRCILRGAQRQAQGENQKWLPNPALLKGPNRGRNSYRIPAFPGVPNAKRREKIRSGCLGPAFSWGQKRAKLLHNPCTLWGPQLKRNEIKSGHLTPCLLMGPKTGELATQPPHSRGSPTPGVGTKSEVATSPLPSRVRKKGRNCYVTPALLGIPNTKSGDNIRSGYLSHVFSGTQKRAKLLCNPCILRGPQCEARGQNQNWWHHPCLLGSPNEGGIAA